MNIIIKSAEQRKNVETILKDFGHNADASSEMREAAETLARRTEEIMRGEYKHD